MFQRLSRIESPHKNTCKWIFDLEEWKEWTREPRGLFWLKGKPGSGKSTIMANIYKQLNADSRSKEGIFLEFFFFSTRGTELQKTPIGMLRSLLNQLFRQDPRVRSRMREVLQEQM